MEASRLTVKQSVHVPSEDAPLVRDVRHDMARGDVNTFGQDTMFQASCCA